MFSKCFSRLETWWNPRTRFWNEYYVIVHVEGERFLCCCLYWTVYNFIVSEHIKLACFLSLCLYQAESSIRKPVLYKTLLQIRISRKTVRQEQVQHLRHKINTKPNQRVHHRIEQVCSWIKTVYYFSVYPYWSESFIGQRLLKTSMFISRTTRANPGFKSSISHFFFSSWGANRFRGGVIAQNFLEFLGL